VQFTGIANEHKGMYTNIFGHLRDAGRRKGREKWRTNSWFFLHDNAATHRSVLVSDFFAKDSVATLQHPVFLT
jgi:hypothetical protein